MQMRDDLTTVILLGYTIAGNESFSITNNSFENKKIYFRVSLAGSSTNYKEVNYVIKIANETPLQP